MQTPKTNVRWEVSLSNGQQATEDIGEYVVVPGELSPWQKLLAYINLNELKITSLALITKDGRRFNLPSSGTNPKFKAFGDAEKPVSYKMFRRMAADVIGTGQLKDPDLFTIAEATYENGKVLQIWVDENSLTSWTLIL